MKKILLLIGLLLPAFAIANEFEDIVQRAFESIDKDFDERWAFTETSTRDDVVRIGRYDPRLPEDGRWTLVSVNGLEPQDDEIEDFLENKENDRPRRGRDDKHDGDAEDEREHSEIVNFGSLELIEETGEHWIFDFVPNEDDDDEKFMQHVKGQLKIIKNGHYVASINLRNEKAIRPAVGVKISKFDMAMSFGPAATDGPIVPIAVDVEVKGRAMLVIRFDEVERTRFSDFEYAP